MEMLERNGGRLVVYLPVELDHHYTEEIREKVDKVVREEPVFELEFDFSRTVFMDSAGIGMILGRYKMMKALSGRMMMSHMRGQIRRILKLSGILNYIQLEQEEEVV